MHQQLQLGSFNPQRACQHTACTHVCMQKRLVSTCNLPPAACARSRPCQHRQQQLHRPATPLQQQPHGGVGRRRRQRSTVWNATPAVRLATAQAQRHGHRQWRQQRLVRGLRPPQGDPVPLARAGPCTRRVRQRARRMRTRVCWQPQHTHSFGPCDALAAAWQQSWQQQQPRLVCGAVSGQPSGHQPQRHV